MKNLRSKYTFLEGTYGLELSKSPLGLFPRDEYQKGQFLRSNRKFRGGSALHLKKLKEGSFTRRTNLYLFASGTQGTPAGRFAFQIVMVFAVSS